MFAPACYPPAQPEAIVNAKLAVAMLEKGWEIDVITNPRADYAWYGSNCFASWSSLLEHLTPVSEYPSTYSHIPLIIKSFLFSKLIGKRPLWSVPAFKVALSLASRKRYDFIISRANPCTAHLAALLLHKQTNVPWIANWNDPMPPYKQPYPYGKGPTHPMTVQDSLFYFRIAKSCNWHTFPCDRLQRYICSYLPSDVAHKSSVIPHIAMHRFSTPSSQHDGFLLLYAGNLKSPRSPQKLLEGLRKFLTTHPMSPPIKMRFIIDNGDSVYDFARAYGVQQYVVVDGPKPYEQMAAEFAGADVLMVSEASIPEGIYFPSKFVDYVQSGKPILALSPMTGTIADFISTHGGGILADCASSDSIAQAIATLYEHWKNGSLGFLSSHTLFDLFSEDRVLTSYEEIFSRLSLS